MVSQCKWVSGIDTYEAEIAADSMIWELFARKSAEWMNLRNSFTYRQEVPALGYKLQT